MTNDQPENFKRVNILLRQDQHKEVMSAGLNMSGLIRGLLDDHFSEEKITLSVSKDVRELYETLISNLGAEDKELEVYFLEALDKFLVDRTNQIDVLRKQIKRK